MPDVYDRIKAALPDDSNGTHWEGCETTHPWCAVQRLLNEVEHARRIAENALNEAAEERRENAELRAKLAEPAKHRAGFSAGDLLRVLRERQGLSLRHVAERAGVDHSYIYRLETGKKTDPSLEVLEALARVLHMTAVEKKLALLLRGGQFITDDLRLAADVLERLESEDR